MVKIPTYKPQKRRPKARRPQKQLKDVVNFKSKSSPKKSKKDPRPSKGQDTSETSPKVKYKRGISKGLASLSQTIPRGGYTGILKAGLAGAAAGAELEATYTEYKASQAKKKAKKATTTVTQSAMAQKKKFHKKDDTKTVRY